MLHILIIMNDYANKTNGMAISTQRFVKLLRAQGHLVRIMAAGEDAPVTSEDADRAVDYPLLSKQLPFFSNIIRNEGFIFASTDRQMIQKAIQWADIVHVEDPFPLCAAAVRIARKEHTPVVGTYHLYPENMTMSAHLGWCTPLNQLLYLLFRKMVYDHCDVVICPSRKVRDVVRRSGCRSKKVIISNGIDPQFVLSYDRSQLFKDSNRSLSKSSVSQHTPQNSETEKHLFTVMTVGRFSPEKDQITLLHAMQKTRHHRQMRLIIGGKGPLEDKIREEAANLDLAEPPVIRYFSQSALKEALCTADVYVHCATVEVEGMSAMEAFGCGAVPVIAQAPLSSTEEFALSEEMLFPHGDSDTLAERLDYWFEHPEELKKASRMMIRKANALTTNHSVEKLLQVYTKLLSL